MELKIKVTSKFIIAEKPYGITTHSVDTYKDGFKEFLEQKTGIELAIVSRLDATTSGLILFPRKDTAAEINFIWQSDCVKTYQFITDRPMSNSQESILMSSFIQQKGSEKIWVSLKDQTPNAETELKFLRSVPTESKPLYLWQAKIKTGKTHQIRLHAKDLGIPILGDTKYGGSPFFRICLHCSEISINEQHFVSEPPFQEIGNSYFPFISEFKKRSQLYEANTNECFRWLHGEVARCLLDQYGQYLFFYVYFNSDSSDRVSETKSFSIATLEKAKQLSEWLATYFGKSIFLKPMYDRGRSPQKSDILLFDFKNKSWNSDFSPITWTAEENGLNFILKSHQGQSPGLFLDQRENRNWVLQNSNAKTVLNLFSYTSGFSVCAAKGNASQVTTVDLSRRFIEWSKENFKLNEIPESENYQFWSADTFHFLKGAINKKRTWDLIICDPPTFGRSEKSTFQIEKDLPHLIRSCFQCLNPDGRIFFATNFEKWNLEDVHLEIQKALSEKKYKFAFEKTTYQSLDFDFPNQNGKMKSVFIKKTD